MGADYRPLANLNTHVLRIQAGPAQPSRRARAFQTEIAFPHPRRYAGKPGAFAAAAWRTTMNILDMITSANNGAAVKQIGSQVGLDEQQTTTALSALMPALAAGFNRNLQSPDGLGSLISALASGNHQKYLDNPAVLNDASAVADGNGILSHVLGSKDVSREVANRVSAQSGIGADVLKRMLPLAATLMMSALSKQSPGAGAGAVTAGIPGSGGDFASMLGPLLDRNRDGSIVDDLTSMIGRFMGGR
jgi:hypothetical protein